MIDVSGWVYAALCNFANKNGGDVQIIKSGDFITIRKDGEFLAKIAVARSPHTFDL